MKYIALTSENGSSPCLVLRGDWTLQNYENLEQAVSQLNGAVSTLDASRMTALDTAGAQLLLDKLGAEKLTALVPMATGLSEERKQLLTAIVRATSAQEGAIEAPRWQFGDGVARLGSKVVSGWLQIILFLGFLGQALVTAARILPKPRRWK